MSNQVSVKDSISSKFPCTVRSSLTGLLNRSTVLVPAGTTSQLRNARWLHASFFLDNTPFWSKLAHDKVVACRQCESSLSASYAFSLNSKPILIKKILTVENIMCCQLLVGIELIHKTNLIRY